MYYHNIDFKVLNEFRSDLNTIFKLLSYHSFSSGFHGNYCYAYLFLHFRSKTLLFQSPYLLISDCSIEVFV